MEGFPIVLSLGLGGEHLGLDHLQDHGVVLFLVSLITSLFSLYRELPRDVHWSCLLRGELNRADHPDIQSDNDDYGK